MYRPNLKSVALPVPEIIGATLKLWAVPGYAVEGHPRYQSKAHMRLPILVRHSNLGPILHRFGDIAGFLCSGVTHPILP